MARWNVHQPRNGGPPRTPDRIVSDILERRGLVSDDDRDRFLHPRLRHLADPLRIPGMDRAVARVEAALAAGEEILLYSDYDVDGMASSALLFRFLTHLGGSVRVFIPDRLAEGYGLTRAGLDRALRPGRPGLLMALDCGTTSRDEVARLRDLGIGVVIIDHHELPAELPPADALVNPQLGEGDRMLATVGLVFKFCHALLKKRGGAGQFDLKAHLDLVALGTVADLVPLENDNRILVRCGLEGMKKTAHVGLHELMQQAGLKRPPTPSTCGFVLGPRLNASGRMADATAGWELLTTSDRAKARQIAAELETLNRQRQQLEQQALTEAEDWIAAHPEESAGRALVVASRDWHPGVVGIVAARLLRKFYRPVFVIALGEGGKGKGSGRGIEGLSLMEALRAVGGTLVGFGGHALAAGVEVEESRVDDFRREINAWLAANTPEEIYQPLLHLETELAGEELDDRLALRLASLEPFGRSNPAPLFAIRGAEVVSPPRVFAQKHLRFRARSGPAEFDVVAFGFGGAAFPSPRPDLAGHWEMDEYTGRPCLRMVDWK
jgi:single-stranded-DNA-specific exonuclease